MSSLSGTGGAIYITGGRKVVTSASWSLIFRTDDELAYGQVREALDHVRLLLLAPCADDPVYWAVVVLDDRSIGWSWMSGSIQTQTASFLRDLPLVTP